MPDLVLLASPEAAQDLKGLMQELGLALRNATSSVLKDTTPEQVAVMMFTHVSGDNASPLQILAIGNSTPIREGSKETWAVALAGAWRKFAGEHRISQLDLVDVWPILVNGTWMMATLEAIKNASRYAWIETTLLPGVNGRWVRLKTLAGYLHTTVERVWGAYFYLCENGAGYVAVAFRENQDDIRLSRARLDGRMGTVN